VWTPVTANVAGTFTFLATQQVAVAWVRQSGNSYTTTIVLAARDELLPLDGVQCEETAGTTAPTGTIAGLGAGEAGQVAMGSGRAVVFSQNTSYSLTNMPAAAMDLVATRIRLGDPAPSRVIVRRDLTVAAGAAIPLLDFASAEALAPATKTLTIEGLVAGETNRAEVTFRTRTVTPFPFSTYASVPAATQSIALVPESFARDGDFHSLDVIGRASATSYRGDRQFFRTASDRTATLGEALAEPLVSQVTLDPHPRLNVTTARQTAYPSFVNIRYDQRPPNTRRVQITATAGYFGAGATWDVDIPDLSTVNGFPTASPLQRGADATWLVEAYNGSASVHLGAIAEGARLRYAGRTGTFAVP
jgi:hypothetical protein